VITRDKRFAEMPLGERIGIVIGAAVVGTVALGMVGIALGLMWRVLKAVWS
jgi:hypothetical protein